VIASGLGGGETLTLADVRDVAIIAGTVVFVVESLVIGALLVVVGLRLLVFIDVAQTRLDDVAVSADSILDSAREAASAANEAAAQVRGSTMFLSDRVVLPAIRLASAVTGAARFARAVVQPGGAPRKGGDRGQG
jgi:K+ transporter